MTDLLKPNILIIDDDESIRSFFEIVLKTDYQVFSTHSTEAGYELIKRNEVDIVLLDVMLGQENGLNVLRQIKSLNPNLEVIMITVLKDIRCAVDAMKEGAYDYVNKDIDLAELKILIRKALEKGNLSQNLQSLKEEISTLTVSHFIEGISPKIKDVINLVNRVGPLPSNVLILGESGTGKEYIARKIHEIYSKKIDLMAPFVSVNMAGIPDDLLESTLFGHEKGSFTGAQKLHRGKFELAHNGTIFLDEIGELKLPLQTKLLRVIQEREIERVGAEYPIKINVRIITATNRNLFEMVSKGTFREDLYYRLNVIPVNMPPLRERMEDLPIFVKHFIHKYAIKLNKRVTRISNQAMSCIETHKWPGNIRELENTIERMVALSESSILSEENLPMELRFINHSNSRSAVNLNELLTRATDSYEKDFLIKTLETQKWNQMKTADLLGIHRKTLEYKIKRLQIADVIAQKKREFRLAEKAARLQIKIS